MSLLQRHHLSISVTIASSFFVLVVALMGLVVWTNFQAHKHSTLELVADLAFQSIAQVHRDLQHHLDPVMAMTSWTESLIAANPRSMTNDQRLADVLMAAMAATPQVTALIYVGADGGTVRAYRGNETSKRRIEISPARNRELVTRTMKRAAANPQGFWNEIIYSEGEKRSFVNFVKPLVKDGKVTGVVLAAVSLNELSDLVADISDRLRGTVFILAGKDKVIAHPNLTSSHPEQTAQTPLVKIGRVGDLVLGQFWSAATYSLELVPALKEIDVRHTEIAGQRYIFTSRTITDYGEPPWVVGGYVDAQTAEAPLQNARRSALFGLGAILIGAMLAIYLGRQIARPIRNASKGIAQIAELDIAHVKALAGSRIAELDAQAKAFNNMLGALRWFALYVPKSLVSRLIRLGGQEIVSQQREVTVLFTDLAGFSTASEKMTAVETADFLNRHFALLGSCVEAEGGTIDKFMGDALMAFWGAPDPQDDHAARAIRAAQAIATAVRRDIEDRVERGEPPVRVRIGLHSGPAVAGNIGAPERMNYTVVGETVNVAQRMEQLGKEIAPDANVIVLATENTILASKIPNAGESAGPRSVKGMEKSLEVFRVAVD